MCDLFYISWNRIGILSYVEAFAFYFEILLHADQRDIQIPGYRLKEGYKNQKEMKLR